MGFEKYFVIYKLDEFQCHFAVKLETFYREDDTQYKNSTVFALTF